MKTSIKKTLLSILLAIIALGLVIGLSLIEIGKFSLAYYLAMFVLGCEIGDNAGKRTEKIFEKIESRKEAKKEEMLREELYSLNPGDRLFLLGFDKVYEYLIVKKSFGPHPTFAIQPVGDTFSGVWDFEVHNYKTTFFPSREEAEAALVKRETPPAIPKKEYHCKNCKESFTYTNFKNPPNHCSFCGGELAETTEIGMILSELFYSVEHEKAEEIPTFPIKNNALCNKCEYGYSNHCVKWHGPCTEECKMYVRERCQCKTIEAGQPCPYFKRFEKKAGAEE